MRVVYDTNVILDVLLNREEFVAESVRAVDAAVDRVVDGLIAAHAITTVGYFLARDVGHARTSELLADLLVDFRIAPVSDEGVRLALASPIADFEDAVTSIAAAQAGAALIVTRDLTDFAKGPVRAVLPQALLSSL